MSKKVNEKEKSIARQLVSGRSGVGYIGKGARGKVAGGKKGTRVG